MSEAEYTSAKNDYKKRFAHAIGKVAIFIILGGLLPVYAYGNGYTLESDTLIVIFTFVVAVIFYAFGIKYLIVAIKLLRVWLVEWTHQETYRSEKKREMREKIRNEQREKTAYESMRNKKL